MSPLYLTMTDTLKTGWAASTGLTNKIVIVCETWDIARDAYAIAIKTPHYKYIQLRSRKPIYPKDEYLVVTYKRSSKTPKDRLYDDVLEYPTCQNYA